jgi:hypothetical protein
MFDPATMTAENPFGGLAMMLDGDVAVQGGGEDESMALSLVMKDGVMYFRDPESEQWMGMSLTDAMSMSGMPFDPSALMGGAGTGMAGLEGLGDMSELMSQIEALASIPGFIDYQRLADEDISGQTAYPFSLTLDFVPLLKSPEFANLIAAVMAASGQEGMEGMSGEQLAMMIPMLLGESTATLNITEWIGKDDLYSPRHDGHRRQHRPTALMGFAGGTMERPQGAPRRHPSYSTFVLRLT